MFPYRHIWPVKVALTDPVLLPHSRLLVRKPDVRASYYLMRSHSSLKVAFFRSITPPFPSSRGIRSRRSLP